MEHRHIWIYSGNKPNVMSGWHDASREHPKYPTMHDVIIETRETGKEGTKVDKRTTTQESDPATLSAKYALKRVEVGK